MHVFVICTLLILQLLSYGPNAVQAPIQYSAEISGANITSRMMNTDTSTVTFSGLPAVDSNIFVTVLASNMFGQGTRSNQVMTEISKLLIVLVDKKKSTSI